ncbi:hypothetical protein SAMN04487926_127132 [Paraburkholderia steynii]|uniref:Uncharacterized protein n=1 Tax=Paraburkholderia steynii TaxID=1245441 RepID=A0A7Z7BDW3_9BURK|nr:hypothetical protein [Paraburkholderia steynii]SDI93940.1 hypothetical protein SAMN04487926_127132 [Paraburkholderia steynii]
MGRPRIEWNDAQLRAIMGALVALDRDFPLDNVRFLDGLVAAVRAITGRVYGAMTYGRLLRDVAPQTGVARRPSTPTIQAAVLRAQALERGAVEAAAEVRARVPVSAHGALIPGAVGVPLAPVPDRVGKGDAHPVAVDAEALRGALAPLVRELLREGIAPVHALPAQQASPPEDGRAEARQLQLATAALEDAHARLRQLEKEMRELHRELGAAQAARDLAGEHVNAMLADLRETIAASGRDVELLARAAGQLARTEKFLKAQNDAARLQASAEADALRTQNRQLRERIDLLVLDNDHYRRALGNRASQDGTPPPKPRR